MPATAFRHLEFDQLSLPAEIKALGRPDAVLGLHPLREAWLCVATILSGGLGTLAGVTAMVTRGTGPVPPAILMAVLLLGGGAALGFGSWWQQLKGKVLLVYLECLVLLDYEQSRVVTVAEEKHLRSFAAPGPAGYAALSAALAALTLVEAQGTPATPQAVQAAVGRGSRADGRSQRSARFRFALALCGIVLGILLLAVGLVRGPSGAVVPAQAETLNVAPQVQSPVVPQPAWATPSPVPSATATDPGGTPAPSPSPGTANLEVNPMGTPLTPGAPATPAPFGTPPAEPGAATVPTPGPVPAEQGSAAVPPAPAAVGAPSSS